MSNQSDEMFFVKINEYPDYEVNQNGDVKNVKTNKILKPILIKGYYRVNLYKNGTRKSKYVHQLVADAFLTKIEDKPYVIHINNIKTDNQLKNLKFASYNEVGRNRLKYDDVNYQFVNEIPPNSLHIKHIKDNDISDIGLYFNKNTNEFYLKIIDNKYRIMYKNPHGTSYNIRFDFNGKQMHYSPFQMKRDYNEYFN